MNKDNEQREISRPIKFRAWMVNENKWFTEGFSVSMDGLFWYDDNENEWPVKGNLILQQFTGLLDKNGKEIYEGDQVAEINNLNELESWGDPLTVEFGQYITDTDSWGLRSPTTGFFLRYKDGSVTGIHSQDEGYGFNAKNLLIVSHIYSSEPIVK